MEEALSAEGSQRHPWASQSCCLEKEKAWCHFLHPMLLSSFCMVTPPSSVFQLPQKPLLCVLRKRGTEREG